MTSDIAGKKIFFIINPFAGGGKAFNWWEDMRPQLDAQKIDYTFALSAGHGTISMLVREAVLNAGARVIVAVGGDGTLFEAINGMIENDALLSDDLVFAASPAGTACDFGRSVYGGRDNLPELLMRGCVRPIDIGRCTYSGHDGESKLAYFINSFDAGAGADTCVALNAGDGRMKRLIKGSKLSYMLSALKVLMTFNYTETVVEAGAETFAGKYIIIGLGNGAFAGGGMKLFPAARLDDGLLDMLLIEKKGRLYILRVFLKAYDGKLVNEPCVQYRQLKRVKISTARPIAIELDGEVPGLTQAEISVLPGLLPLLAPE